MKTDRHRLRLMLSLLLSVSAFQVFPPSLRYAVAGAVGVRRFALRQLLFWLAVVVIYVGGSVSAFAQGSLTPSGPPGPTMLTLDQLGAKTDTANAKLDALDAKAEKRAPISSLPFTITASGSYYLTGNLQFSATTGDAITINVNNVTIDLKGFTLSSTAAVTGNAIAINGALRNIAVRNGVIAGNTTVTITGNPPNQTWTTTPAGFGGGIRSLSANPVNCQFSHLRISGCRESGVSAGEHATIDDITATLNGNTGIGASNGSVTGSTANSNGSSGITAIDCSVTGSIANSNGFVGITVGGGIVTTSVANSNGFAGISALDGSVTNSNANSNHGSGINASSVTSSNAKSNGTIGITASSVTSSNASFNAGNGISVNSGSVTTSTANSNGGNGIFAPSGVVAFCKAGGNNTLNNGSLEINATGASRTGNNPTP
jgi:hypothetical protein